MKPPPGHPPPARGSDMELESPAGECLKYSSFPKHGKDSGTAEVESHPVSHQILAQVVKILQMCDFISMKVHVPPNSAQNQCK